MREVPCICFFVIVTRLFSDVDNIMCCQYRSWISIPLTIIVISRGIAFISSIQDSAINKSRRPALFSLLAMGGLSLELANCLVYHILLSWYAGLVTLQSLFMLEWLCCIHVVSITNNIAAISMCRHFFLKCFKCDTSRCCKNAIISMMTCVGWHGHTCQSSTARF